MGRTISRNSETSGQNLAHKIKNFPKAVDGSLVIEDNTNSTDNKGNQ